MSKIIIPTQFRAILNNSEFDGPLQILLDRAGQILYDNTLPFFPYYTDHGTDHISNVLASEATLVPNDCFTPSASGYVLTAVDAASVVCSTILHDIAMHVHPPGFVELIKKGSRFVPVAWFAKAQDDYPGDKLWNVLWEDYEREARRFRRSFFLSRRVSH